MTGRIFDPLSVDQIELIGDNFTKWKTGSKKIELYDGQHSKKIP